MEQIEGTAGLLRPGERLDDLERGGLRLIQHPQRFCFGIDAVLLSAFAQAHARERVLDLCTGSGVIPILMSAKTKCRNFTGLELHAATADMAQRSVRLNGLEQALTIRQGDLRCMEAMCSRGAFDVVTCNPPYMPVGHGRMRESAGEAAKTKEKAEEELHNTGTGHATDEPSPCFVAGTGGSEPDSLTMARHEVCASLEDVCAAAAYALREQGRFYMVHRPFRLAEIFRSLGRFRLEPKRMRLVQPMAGREPNLVLIEARKGSASGLQMEAPLIVYDRPGVYTQEALRMYGKA